MIVVSSIHRSSISTVMFREGASVRDLTVASEEKDVLGDSGFGRWFALDRISCIFLWSGFRTVLVSPPLSGCCFGLELRSSVTLEDVTSLRSSSEDLRLVVADGMGLLRLQAAGAAEQGVETGTK